MVGIEMDRRVGLERDGWTVSSVLWNVFPDLRIRNERRQPVAGLEVKAIHTAAEEKAANLSTPLHSIRKGHDFLVVLLWSWHNEQNGSTQFIYPKIIKHYVFDAYHLARARDYMWLANSGTRVKGIDLGTPVISPEGTTGGSRVKAEEGNMGKLMRIGFSPEMANSVPDGAKSLRVINDYERFQDEALLLGITQTFRELCDEAGWSDVGIHNLEMIPRDLTIAGTASGVGHRVFAVCGNLRASSHSEHFRDGDTVVHFGSKLDWKVLRVRKGRLHPVSSGKKAESCYAQIIESLR
jgi:hypothetical protein